MFSNMNQKELKIDDEKNIPFYSSYKRFHTDGLSRNRITKFTLLHMK